MADEANYTGIILGGVMALAGTALSQVLGLLSGWVDRRHQRDVRQRERLEEMADSVSVTQPWFQALMNCRNLEEIKAARPPIEARRIVTIAHLYFPAISIAAEDYHNSLVRFHMLAMEAWQIQRPASAGAKMVIAAKGSSQSEEDLEEPKQCRQKLDNAIAEEAKKYMHT